MIEIGIQSEILQEIIDGKKTVEGRLAKDKFLGIKPGDVISLREDIYENGVIVSSITGRLKISIDTVSRFESFRQMLSEIGFQHIIPGAKDTDDALTQYRLYYSEADEAKYGINAFAFHVVS